MKRGITLMIAAALTAAVAAGGWYWFDQRASAAQAEAPLLAQVQRGDIEDLVSATGTIQPRDYVDVGAQVSGQLEKIHVEVGSTVKAGDLLAEIDPTLYRARVDATRAQLENQRAQMLDRQAQLDLASLNHKRQKNLMAAEATTAEALQTAEATLRSARAQLAALQAQIRQSESTLRAEEAQLNYAKIYAPMSGTVVSITARQGQTLNTNQQAPVILQIADLSTMTVQAQVSEADVGRLRVGMPVWFTTLGGQDRRWQGELRKIEPTPVVTNNVVLFNALFDVPNPRRTLMTQMTAQVFFVVASASDVLTVPVAALTASARRPAADGRGPADGPVATRAERGGESARRSGADAGANADATASADAGARADAGANAAGLNATAADAGASAAAANAGATGASGDAAAAAPARESADAASGFEPPANKPRRRFATMTVVSTDGSKSERRVEVGVSNRVLAEIVSGLAEGDQVQVGVRRSGTAGAAEGPGRPPMMSGPRIAR